MNILIVDDDTALTAILALQFEDLGYAVSVAHDCCQTRKIILECQFDLVLMDYQLPDGTGLELIGGLRQTSPHVKVIMMSGLEEQKLQDLLSAEGLEYFLPKPIHSARLDSLVREVLEA